MVFWAIGFYRFLDSLLCMGDLYLEQLDALQGQPKKIVGDYVESQGLLVPRRFSSLDTALGSGMPFIIRSEHPFEYADASGLLKSFIINEGKIEENKVRAIEGRKSNYASYDMRYWWQKEFEAISRIGSASQEELEKDFVEISSDDIENYCGLLGLDVETFKHGVSFSYWEFLGGYNRTIVADSAIKGRYHIFSITDTTPHTPNYTIFDNGTVNSLPWSLPNELEIGLDKVVSFYENIRGLRNFDANHCPLIEFQTVNGENYFLQYHRTRDFKEPTFQLNRGLEDGEVKASLVRGATPENGVVVNTAIYHARNKIEPEDAAFNFNLNSAFNEVMSSRRQVQFVSLDPPYVTLEGVALELVVKHRPKSIMFKPEVTVVLNRQELLSMDELDSITNKMIETEMTQKIPFQVISDGKKAYVKRIR